jgi:hypothetical protein
MDALQEAYMEMMNERSATKVRIRLPKLDKPIIKDAIKGLSTVKQAIKFNNKGTFLSTLKNQKYFNASESAAFQSQLDLDKRNRDSESYILKNSGDLVAVWDNKKSVGYIVPADKIFE